MGLIGRLRRIAESDRGKQALSAARSLAEVALDRVLDRAEGRPPPPAARPHPAPPTEQRPTGRGVDASPTQENTATGDDPTARAKDAASIDAAPTLESVSPLREPIRTRTMAQLLASQGHFDRALAIYDDLLRDHPGDGDLRQEQRELRGRAERASGVPPEDTESDGLVTLRRRERELEVRWQVTMDAIESARAELGEDGLLEMRIVDPSSSRIVEHHGGLPLEGTWKGTSDTAGPLRATIGLVGKDRTFVPVAETPPVR
ncbi:MAG: hypothetical protein KC416_06325 [Myxococcales bacterium]|nr:hypothetical protein [Myxococcales bacterium]